MIPVLVPPQRLTRTMVQSLHRREPLRSAQIIPAVSAPRRAHLAKYLLASPAVPLLTLRRWDMKGLITSEPRMEETRITPPVQLQLLH